MLPLRLIFAGLSLLLSTRGLSQARVVPPTTARLDSLLPAKAYPLLAFLETQPALRQLVKADKVMQTIAQNQARRSYQLLTRQPPDLRQYVDSLIWQPQEIKRIAQEMNKVYATDKQFQTALAPLLSANGPYPRYAAGSDTATLRLAWQDAAQGLNRIARVYLASVKPRYPAIDSISFTRQDAALTQAVSRALRQISKGRPTTFYALPLQAALTALRLNGRDEAVRYESLAAGLNAAPRAAVARTDWSRFPYSLILVPGMGPEQPGVALDSMSAYRCRLAAARYRAGQAPFVVVSGGHVHPNKTPYCEAVEMKKYLVETLGLPDAAVFIEPYARHTTTNLRNVGRLVYAFGLPANKPLLTVTDAGQSRYILGMAERCRQELGYVPYRDLRRLSEVENTCWPVPEVRQPDPLDPLDP
jgi:hypothetical protein